MQQLAIELLVLGKVFVTTGDARVITQPLLELSGITLAKGIKHVLKRQVALRHHIHPTDITQCVAGLCGPKERRQSNFGAVIGAIKRPQAGYHCFVPLAFYSRSGTLMGRAEATAHIRQQGAVSAVALGCRHVEGRLARGQQQRHQAIDEGGLTGAIVPGDQSAKGINTGAVQPVKGAPVVDCQLAEPNLPMLKQLRCARCVIHHQSLPPSRSPWLTVGSSVFDGLTGGAGSAISSSAASR